MENNNTELLTKELASFEDVGSTVILENTPFLKSLAGAYRDKLGDHYKGIMSEAFVEQINLDLVDQFIQEAAYIMQASNDEILKMFFEDAQNKASDMEEKDYFNQVFEVAAQFP
ncbi:hypothetical protein [Lysinibacillus fusiformis]|uniref:hypothetical protein n=1 Tax=Lysinibacillus fusiformis TaxID=28031 RepID=UPI000468A35E|nr:hypothetical protein [Lysinibacillus fusiformis]